MRINLIPMAGAGKRFSEAGYRLPKPLIPISGKPMVLNAIEDLPQADRWVFVVREEHVKNFRIDQLLLDVLPKAQVITETHPRGQATSCLLAREHIPDDASLLISSCDSGFLYNQGMYERLLADPSIDAVVFTFTERETLRRSPPAWGWHELESDGRTIKRVRVKETVSKDPFHDHAVVATFWFRRARDFFDAVDFMVTRNERTNDEFYIDTVPNYFQELGKRAIIFDVDLYVGWGKPDDMYEYQRMEYLCRYGGTPISEEERRLLPLWQQYFQNKDKRRIRL